MNDKDNGVSAMIMSAVGGNEINTVTYKRMYMYIVYFSILYIFTVRVYVRIFLLFVCHAYAIVNKGV